MLYSRDCTHFRMFSPLNRRMWTWLRDLVGGLTQFSMRITKGWSGSRNFWNHQLSQMSKSSSGNCPAKKITGQDYRKKIFKTPYETFYLWALFSCILRTRTFFLKISIDWYFNFVTHLQPSFKLILKVVTASCFYANSNSIHDTIRVRQRVFV